MKHRIGTLDFYPNGGSNHPGCNDDAAAILIESYHQVCDHARSWHFYQATVRDPKAFPAIRCSSWEEFLINGKCDYNDIEFMGFGANAR